MAGLSFTIHDNFTAELARQLASTARVAENIVANQAQRDTEPFVPAMTKSLVNRTQVVGDTIIYPGPYARYLYYGKVMVDAATGKGPMKFVNQDGDLVIRFKKGAVLKPIDCDLKISKAVHSKAQSHWFEASKAQNLEKWERVAEKAVVNHLKNG